MMVISSPRSTRSRSSGRIARASLTLSCVMYIIVHRRTKAWDGNKRPAARPFGSARIHVRVVFVQAEQHAGGIGDVAPSANARDGEDGHNEPATGPGNVRARLLERGHSDDGDGPVARICERLELP